ncbi:MAG: hypothetical protein U1F23_01495 [Lysobacterales bacterium]
MLDDANAAVRARLPWDRDGFRARVDQLLERFAAIALATGDALARDAHCARHWAIFVIGVPRSGSTSSSKPSPRTRMSPPPTSWPTSVR